MAKSHVVFLRAAMAVCTLAPTAVSSQSAQVTVTRTEYPPKSAEEEWIDENYVPCKGVGVGAFGKVRARAKWVKFPYMRGGGWGLNLLSFELITGYSLAHDPSASISFVGVNGRSQTITLQRPWFAYVRAGGDKTKSLFLPKGISNKQGPSGQRPIGIDADNPEIKIKLTTKFPNASGACLSSFEQTMVLR